MAWLSGLAGKAEHLLNKIDQNTAAVLNKDKTGMDAGLTEVKWVSPETSITESINGNYQFKPENVIQIPEVVSVQETGINDSETHIEEQVQDTFVNIISAPVPLVTPLETANHVDSDSEMSLQSGRSSPSSAHHSIDMLMNNKSTDISSEECNLDTTNEITKSPKGSINYRLSQVQAYNNYPMAFSKIRTLEDKNDLLNRQQTDHQKEITALTQKLHNLTVEKRQFVREIMELKANMERSKLELDSTKSNLEQHKARASKILQEKEKLIAELRSNSNTSFDESAVMEINQLKQEKENLRDENQQISEQLKISRQELLIVESKVEKIKSEIQEAKIQAQEVINIEKRRRVDAEDDAKHQLEEIRSLKEELSTLRQNFSTKSVRQENEIIRLRNQISAMSIPSSEVESRISSLTQTLVSKQQALENLTTERNALRLQLEKLEQNYRMLSNACRTGSYNSVNDTDDVKAQVPTFLVETPFDTSVARRVKRAYSTLDAISVRTGVFLRRYPLARILVFIYMALLQFWVLVVLLSQSPDAH